MRDQVKQCSNKNCNAKGKYLDLSLFFKSKYRKFGVADWCKECYNLYNKRPESLERKRLAQKKYYFKNKDKQNKKGLASPSRRYKNCERGAKFRQIEFALSFDEFCKLTEMVCSYCGEYSFGKSVCGIDRVDSKLRVHLDEFCSLLYRM